MKPSLITYVDGADRMVTGAGLAPKGLHVRFADDREGFVPLRDLELDAVPEYVTVPNPHVIEVHLSDGRVEEVPWDFARHYADPTYRRRSMAAAERGRRALGERLRAFRSKIGITQDELARRSGVNRVTVARIESAAQLPRYQTLEALAAGLGVSVDRLITG